MVNTEIKTNENRTALTTRQFSGKALSRLQPKRVFGGSAFLRALGLNRHGNCFCNRVRSRSTPRTCFTAPPQTHGPCRHTALQARVFTSLGIQKQNLFLFWQWMTKEHNRKLNDLEAVSLIGDTDSMVYKPNSACGGGQANGVAVLRLSTRRAGKKGDFFWTQK